VAQPNIILITAGQLRWDCLGYTGNPDVRTPNLDVLAAHAVNFTEAICQQPGSVPSRSTLLTGLHPRAHGVIDNRDALPAGIPSFPQLLRQHGYRTAAVGKMDFNPTRADHGIDRLVLAEQNGPGREEDDYHTWLKDQDRVDRIDLWNQMDREHAPLAYLRSFGAMPSNLPEPFHSTTWIGDQAVRFLQQGGEEPFMLWVSFIKPHHPFDPPRPWDKLYEPRELELPPGFCLPVPEYDARHGGFFEPRKMTEARFRRVLAFYYANISHLDQQVGRMLATLTARGITNNLFIFTSDHGGYMGQHGLITKENQQAYDSLLRVPLLIAGLPGQRRAVKEPALAQLTDVFPTILDAVGLDPPPTAGRSLVPLLREAGQPLREAAFAEDPCHKTRIVRTDRYKLIESSNPDFRAFYDLQLDPHEYANRYDHPAYQDVRARLASQLDAALPGNVGPG
jgi:arylsulfatase A-like enzyme